ncbi:YbaB/EbfC family nucleoid-associated protein [Actinoplanes derwentensis]|uniref:YbaB/EbfC DNA-binding family protein n=1 Tax=Actinoplanes derwentensis TaxID=113562 RepID=A0A1H1XM28_9ACTN|nr:YbaB/EbfC family nucleoid-associated protein [Actinoplanes derwentensis]GID87738.1 hypothetical protein Ade03nite_66620 [Actinoplanes derwentensis]SDT10258.1 YbaB/EbfC DNA-binding family protein [Actinoplanes derwentensis]
MDGDRVERLFAEYERQRGAMADMQRRMSEISVTVTSPRREVSVTVGQNGVLTGIDFPSGAHKRLTTADLTRLVMAAYTEAKEKALDQAAELLAPSLPAGIDARGLVRGSTDSLMPAQPRFPESVRELLMKGRSTS